MLKDVYAYLSRKSVRKAAVSLIHTNSMVEDTTNSNEAVKYVCADIEDFLKMEQHHAQVISSV